MTSIRIPVFALLIALSGGPVLAADGDVADVSDKPTKCSILVPTTVSIHPDFRQEDRVEAIRKNDALQRIQDVVACHFEEHHYKALKPFKLGILISDLRLRSGASAFWLGGAAGADRIGLHVKVELPTGAPYEFKTNSSTVKGGMMKPDPRQRINYMAQDLARKISKELEGEGFIAD